MTPEIAVAVRRLAASGEAITVFTEGLSLEEASWRPAPERWSTLEVLNHLADEEVEDFRTRLDILLHRPDAEFPPINPPAWVVERHYAERGLEESITRFRQARVASLAWLESLGGVDLDAGRNHPALGALSGRQMLASWMAHDLLHLRQITRNRYEQLAAEVDPLSLAYAGEWK